MSPNLLKHIKVSCHAGETGKNWDNDTETSKNAVHSDVVYLM